MKKQKIISVVGARPNFMKVAPLHRAFCGDGQIESIIVHTGQHYDEKMSDIFFRQLGMPKPHHFLGIGGGSHTFQTAHIMLKFEKIIEQEKPDIVLVVGDVNSTMACAIVAVKMGIKTVHVEAGLRSGDRSMPEEINRILTDSICDQLFVTEQSGLDHLAAEGVADEKIHFVGNVMIDSIVHYREAAKENDILKQLGARPKEFVLVTMHRPSNVDNLAGLTAIVEILRGMAKRTRIVMPLHPRTRNNLEKHDLLDTLSTIENIVITQPLGFIEFLALMDNAVMVVTDSGGIQEETTYLQVPCITFRDSTERPITVDLGTNVLMKDLDPKSVLDQFNRTLDGEIPTGTIPPMWDGKTAERIKDILLQTSI